MVRGRGRGRIVYVVAPDGQAGGGMGRVKDYILGAAPGIDADVTFVPLVTRDHRGVAMSLYLVLCAVATIWRTHLAGRLALVHVNLGDHGSAVRKGAIVMLSRLVGARVLLHLHAVELEREYATASAPMKWLIRRPFLAANCVAVLGARWQRWLSQDLGVPPGRIETVWNGVPVELAAGRRHDSGRPLTILFAGNLIERKGVQDLIPALAMLRDIPGWHAVFAGGGEVDRFRDMARAHGLGEDCATFLGWLDYGATKASIARADVLVLPSYEEGLPLVILESLGLGTPVVCTPVGSVPEVLADRETAMFCRPGDVAGIAAAIRALLEDPALRQRLCDAGMAKFASDFSIGGFMAHLFRIWRRIGDWGQPALAQATRPAP